MFLTPKRKSKAMTGRQRAKRPATLGKRVDQRNIKQVRQINIVDINPNISATKLRCIWSPCLLNLYAEYLMRNAGLEEAQAGIEIARRNINNLRYADDTTFMAESELKSLLMKVKEES